MLTGRNGRRHQRSAPVNCRRTRCGWCVGHLPASHDDENVEFVPDATPCTRSENDGGGGEDGGEDGGGEPLP